jgi:hypothetical protein
MKEAGEKFDVPVVDLYSRSREFLQEIGPKEAKKYYMNVEPGIYDWLPKGLTDNSHLKYEGAMLYAGMIAKEIEKLSEPYCSLIADKDYLKETYNIEING